jgi:LmbE family N-acetylglucosaminyl deacetylase
MPENGSSVVMVISAHHDDNELVAGTLAHYKAAGWEMVSVVVTEGSWIKGKVAEEHIAIREAESRDSAALMGWACSFLRLPEGLFRNGQESRATLVEQIRRFAPAVVITHPPLDYHRDHMQVSRCVYECIMSDCSSPFIKTSSPPCSAPMLYYCDSWFTAFEPDCFVAISGDEMDLKCQMLACHKSQLPSDGSNEESMIDLVKIQNRTRGIQAGFRYAEAFRFQPMPGRGRSGHLLV